MSYNSQDLCTHEATGVTGTRAAWWAFGATTDTECNAYRLPHGSEQFLFRAIRLHDGATDQAVLLTAIELRESAREAKTRDTANARLADSLASFANAVRSGGALTEELQQLTAAVAKTSSALLSKE